MTVNDIMTQNVITAKGDTKITDVAFHLLKYHVHAIPIINDNKNVIGIVTESDFFVKDLPNLYLPSYIEFLEKAKKDHYEEIEENEGIKKLMSATAKDIMTKDVFTVSPKMKIKDLTEIFKKKRLFSLPVVEEKKLVGIVTLADVIQLL